MFTGIIEKTATVLDIKTAGSNQHFKLALSFAHELKVDQSVAHNGVCLTVTAIEENHYWVTAIDETLKRTDLNHWKIGKTINIERCMLATSRFDGHIVQGHVDTIGHCKQISNKNGSWVISVEYQESKHITVEKGSICLNGISLTVVDSYDKGFTVAIIPYTWEHTNLSKLQVGDPMNLEFDIIGKYMAKMMLK